MREPSSDPKLTAPRGRSPWRFVQFSLSTSMALMLLAAAGYKVWSRPKVLDEPMWRGEAKLRRQVRPNAEGQPQNAGWWMLYDGHDRPRFRGHLVQGVPSSRWNAWYANGQPQIRAACWGGQRHGTWTEWHENGQKRLEMQFANDQAEGLFRMWHDDGTAACEGTFAAGVRVAKWTWWNRQGEMEAEGTYENGQPSSDWKGPAK